VPVHATWCKRIFEDWRGARIPCWGLTALLRIDKKTYTIGNGFFNQRVMFIMHDKLRLALVTNP
jgi:hypothetical protein